MQKTLTLFLIIFLASSCSLSPSWDVEGVAPIIKSRLDFNSLIGDEYVQSAPDSALTFVFEDTLYKLNIDTLSKNIAINELDTVLWTFPTLTIVGFDPLLNAFKLRIPFNLGDARLSSVVIKNGRLQIIINSVMNRGFKFRYHSQKIVKNGVPFEYLGYVAPAATGDTTKFYAEMDMSGYEFDLSPITNNVTNTLELFTDIQFDSTGGPLQIFANQLLFTTEVKINELNLYSIKGYLGKYDFGLSNSSLELDFLKKFTDGTVDVSNVQVDLQVANYIGADAQLYINSIKGTNTRSGNSVNVSGAGIQQTFNVNRAIYSGAPSQFIIPSIFDLLINSSNSNINQLISILPDKITLDANVKLNPFGNNSGYEDFYYPDYPTYIYGSIVAPLKFSINQVKFIDTLSNPFIDFELGKNFLSGELRAKVINKFPFAASAEIVLLENNAIVETITSTNPIQAAPVNAQFRVINPIESNLIFNLTESKFEKLRNADKIIIKVRFETEPTSQLLQMYSDYFIDFKITSDIQFRIQL